MKGFAKAVKRTPFMVTSKVGMSKKSTDPEFDDYQRHFTDMEKATEKLLKDTKAFMDAVTGLFTAGAGFSTHFFTLFNPISGEYDLIGRHPDSEHTIKNVEKYQAAMEDLRGSIGPELELIESRISGPVKELQTVMKSIRKTITKRDHKLVDYDRFNNSLTKLRDKKDKSLTDERNLFKLEQDFEIATNEYEYINSALKQDLPRFMQLATQFIDPLFHSFFYMQLNIYYIMLERMNSFGEEAKMDISNRPGSQIAEEYEGRRGDVVAHVENLQIIKRIISVSRMVQASRSNTTLGRAPSSATTSSVGSAALRAPPPARSPSSASTLSYKKAPPPPPGATAAPPPYSPPAPSNGAAFSAAPTKRAPPPPPLKPKPKPAPPPVQYVVALYDFSAQTDGDLSFRTGDRIELVQRTESSEDWWTGKLNGQQGVFPGNYVQET